MFLSLSFSVLFELEAANLEAIIEVTLAKAFHFYGQLCLKGA